MPFVGDRDALLEKMARISLQEMQAVKLMDRTDTKFVAREDLLIPLLQNASQAGYRVQYTGSALAGYDTVYYDTPGLEMYLLHHNRKLCRQKIRRRTYLESGISFLEIKNKNNKGRTRKIRIPADLHVPLAEQARAREFIGMHTGYLLDGLAPALETVFRRITLVNPALTERITIDLELEFRNCRNGNRAALGGLLVIELKQDGRYPSRMRQLLYSLGIKPFKISKYCIGTALTDPLVKRNRFLRKIHLLDKLKLTI